MYSVAVAGHTPFEALAGRHGVAYEDRRMVEA